MKCPSCNGYGYDESPRYYYGRVECPTCEGLGRVNSKGNAFTVQQWEEYLSYPGDPEELFWDDEEEEESDEASDI